MDSTSYQKEIDRIEQICLEKNLIPNGKTLLVIITDNAKSKYLFASNDENQIKEEVKKVIENGFWNPYFDEDVAKGIKEDPNLKLNIENIDTLLRIDKIIKFLLVPISYTENAKVCTKVAHQIKTLGYINVVLAYDISIELDQEKLCRHLQRAVYNANNFSTSTVLNIAYVDLTKI